MPRRSSAGLLMYRLHGGEPEVLLVHLGGPFWTRKDVWFLPKGEIEEGEDELAAAQREFQEETGFASSAPYLDLGEVRHKSGKRVRAWAFEGDCDPSKLASNTFEIEWPPRSGRRRKFPEIDRAAWFAPAEARQKMHEAEQAFVERLVTARQGAAEL